MRAGQPDDLRFPNFRESRKMGMAGKKEGPAIIYAAPG